MDGQLLLRWRGGARGMGNDPLFPSQRLHLSLKQPPDVGAIKHSLDKQGTFLKKLTTPKRARAQSNNLRNETSPSGEKSRPWVYPWRRWLPPWLRARRGPLASAPKL